MRYWVSSIILDWPVVASRPNKDWPYPALLALSEKTMDESCFWSPTMMHWWHPVYSVEEDEGGEVDGEGDEKNKTVFSINRKKCSLLWYCSPLRRGISAEGSVHCAASSMIVTQNSCRRYKINKQTLIKDSSNQIIINRFYLDAHAL